MSLFRVAREQSEYEELVLNEMLYEIMYADTYAIERKFKKKKGRHKERAHH
jgi:hypothetical protein